MIAREDMRDELVELGAVAVDLGRDEVRVLVEIAKRLKVGATVYGRLRLADDRRSFRDKEACEEIEDFLVYLACAWLKERRAVCDGSSQLPLFGVQSDAPEALHGEASKP